MFLVWCPLGGEGLGVSAPYSGGQKLGQGSILRAISGWGHGRDGGLFRRCSETGPDLSAAPVMRSQQHGPGLRGSDCPSLSHSQTI